MRLRSIGGDERVQDETFSYGSSKPNAVQRMADMVIAEESHQLSPLVSTFRRVEA